MSTHKAIDKICCVVLCLSLVLTVLFMNAEHFGVTETVTTFGYESRLFDNSKVHTVDIVMDGWDDFIADCKNEEYSACTVVIDNEAFKNVAIRGKGNTSLTEVESYGNDRYSFKIEFDHYDSSKTYYGLDKLCLNNIIQDNTYMKDFLCYTMMSDMSVASPLCSYVYITVNGEDWGLYLAVEAIEEAFLTRNYGNDYGELYKPDSQSLGGGRGNGKDFDADNLPNGFDGSGDGDDFKPDTENDGSISRAADSGGVFPNDKGNGDFSQGFGGNGSEPPDGFNEFEQPDDTFGGDRPDNETKADGFQDNFKDGRQNGSDDVLLKYIDDSVDSYSNIFDNAKTDATASDKARLIESLKSLSAGEDIADVVDVEAVIRYFAVHNFVLNFDSYTGSMIHNYYLYEENGRLSMLPWDYNLAFGGFESSSGAEELINYPIDTPVSSGSVSDRPMLAWIFENSEYLELYHEILNEFTENYFESGYFTEFIDSVIEMIDPYVQKDPTKFITYDQFVLGSSTLKSFCMLRAESVRAQLDGSLGSTDETQEAEAMIDASDISVSDMGGMMNNGMNNNITDMPNGVPGDMPSDMPNGKTDDMPSDIPNSKPDDIPNGGFGKNDGGNIGNGAGNSPPEIPGNFTRKPNIP